MNYDAIAAWDARAQDLFGFMLIGRADAADVAEFNRTLAQLQGALCAGEWPLEDTDAIVGKVRIDREALEEWEQARSRDFDVTDEVPF
jgi:hypothetical protein